MATLCSDVVDTVIHKTRNCGYMEPTFLLIEKSLDTKFPNKLHGKIKGCVFYNVANFHDTVVNSFPINDGVT